MRQRLFFLCCLAACMVCCTTVQAKELKDTLFSTTGDRLILSYSLTQSGGQVTVRFNNVQKKLGKQYQDKYKKLNEVAVVMFDRTGNYTDVKFEGQTTSAFMVPANVTYTPSEDGYYLIQENPQLQFSVKQGEKAQLDIPLYLAHYEGKHRYKVFGRCGTLKIETGGGKAVTNVAGGGAAQAEVETTITSEELVDEGLAPADEATIRISSIESLLEKVNKLPFPEELTHEVAMLRELRFKVTDEGVSKQISKTLEAYDSKRQELEAQAEANQQAAAAQQAAKASQAQAMTDSLSAMTALQAAKDKKDMMWLIGGIGGLALLIFGGKQVFQMVKNNQMQKAQRKMMEDISKMATGGMGGAANPFGNVPGMQQAQQKAENQVRRVLSKEGEAAKQRLQQMKKKPEVAETPKAEPKRPSLNDQIPAKYKRWRKPGQSPNNNVTI